MALLAAAAGCFALAQTSLTGAGATFPAPLYQKWFNDYQAASGGTQINYQAIGSGGGIRQVTDGTVDFGASDGPMTDEQLKAFQSKHGSPVLHFPTVLGAAVLTYNIGSATELKFTQETLVNIFMGRIKKWNDPALAKANPGAKLPDLDIIVVHRSDGSGTTYVWTDYLSKISSEWKTKVGTNTSVRWPVGLGAKGNDGVTAQVKQTKGAIGYVELVYAVKNKLPYGLIRNKSGSFVKADLNSVTAAADSSAKSMPEDFRVSITDPMGSEVYPISTYTWLLVPSQIKDSSKKAAMVKFLNWMLTSGQQSAEQLTYAKLPASVIQAEKKAIAKVK